MKLIDDFIQRVQAARHRLGMDYSVPWFRGHSSKNYVLMPTLLRREFIEENGITNHRQFEKNLACDFVTRAGDEIPSHFDTWQLLSLMRHYEMPTRLLDWTTSLSVALYFALMEGSTTAEPHIWIMNPHILNSKVTGKVIVFDSVDSLDISYFDCLLARTEYQYHGPVAIKLPLNNPRIRAQRGCFTFHGDGLDGTNVDLAEPLNKAGSRVAIRIDIPEELIPKLRLLLDLDGTDEYFVYPELHNLSKSLTRRAKINGMYKRKKTETS